MPTPTQLKLVKELNRQEIPLCVARWPATSQLFYGSSNGNVYVSDVATEKPEFRELSSHTSYVTGIAVAERFVISGSYDGRLIWWDHETLQSVRNVEAHPRWIRKVVASPDSKIVASVADDMVCRLWDVETGAVRTELRGHQLKTPHHFPSMLYTCAFSSDGSRLATADRVGHIVVWDVTSGQSLVTLEAPVMYTWDEKQRIHSIGGVRSLAFSPDGRLLAVGGMGQVGNIDHLEGKARVEIFDWQKQERTHELPSDQFKGLVEKLTFGPDGDWLLAAGGDNGGFLEFFNVADGKSVKQEKIPAHVNDCVLNESADTAFIASHNKISVWQLASMA